LLNNLKGIYSLENKVCLGDFLPYSSSPLGSLILQSIIKKEHLCFIFFLAPPSIYYVDPPTETGTEENVTLTCQASGLPQPTFTWITPDDYAVNATAPFYESKDLDDGSKNRRGKILQEDGSLLIFNTRDVDQGVYKCVAENVMGRNESRVILTVKKGKNSISHLPFLNNFISARFTRSSCIGEERLLYEI